MMNLNLNHLKRVIITSYDEFEMCLKKGINPLFWHRFIKMDMAIRKTIQTRLFGNSELNKRNIVLGNDKYYHYCFEHGSKCCENCGKPFNVNRNLDKIYSSVFISHIISRSNAPEMAHDPRNHNKLCLECHKKWESQKRNEMLIYLDNLFVINELKKDY